METSAECPGRNNSGQAGVENLATEGPWPQSLAGWAPRSESWSTQRAILGTSQAAVPP